MNWNTIQGFITSCLGYVMYRAKLGDEKANKVAEHLKAALAASNG
mgnify:CR=1 FL=1|tara:strand:+ start:3117 stop:3251 length:135 start_codon:yes stop_codon:yes gene_type:complete